MFDLHVHYKELYNAIFVKIKLEAEEIVQLIKYLLYKHEDLRLHPQHLCKVVWYSSVALALGG